MGHLVREHAAQPAAVLDAQVLEEVVELGVGEVQVLRGPKRLAQLACTGQGAGCGVRGAWCAVCGVRAGQIRHGRGGECTT